MLTRQVWQEVDGFAEVEKGAGPAPAVMTDATELDVPGGYAVGRQQPP